MRVNRDSLRLVLRHVAEHVSLGESDEVEVAEVAAMLRDVAACAKAVADAIDEKCPSA